ncbi:MAG: hypothetical protein RI897_608 [Verrucomicrobiota bacterium]
MGGRRVEIEVGLDDFLACGVPADDSLFLLGDEGHEECGGFDEGFVRGAFGGLAGLDALDPVEHVIGLLWGFAAFVALG